MHDPSSALFQRSVRYRDSLGQTIGAAALMLCVLPLTVIVWAVAATAV
jgi:hypothetical protein